MNDVGVELDRVQPGDAVTLSFAVSAADMDLFRRLSGDDNPIHHDPAFARRRGFSGPLVYGGLIVAQVSKLLGTRLPGYGCVWQSLTLRFRSPLFVDEPAALQGAVRHLNAELGVVLVGLRIDAGSRRIAEGEAQALLARERRQ